MSSSMALALAGFCCSVLLIAFVCSRLACALLRRRRSRSRRAPPLPHYGGMVHLGPHAAYAYQYQPPAAYPSYGWVPAAAPPQHLVQYVPGELLHARHQYVPNEAPLWFNDENPNGCCSVQ